MPFSKDKPYNELPLLPPAAPLETTAILKKAVSAHRQLLELLFERPYCKVKFLVDRDIAKRQRAAVYLKTLEEIGVLRKKKVGKENLYLNVNLYELLAQ
ncbi:MAG: hypothetical protein SWH78_15485 [Thermodesulfobacteriota bacterium]|nr:hypothetical protein [Thermodesulfobacteriota bacterium]